MTRHHPYDIALQTYQDVLDRGPAFFIDKTSAAYLGDSIIAGGDGDHVEIGVAYGGSAIFAALIKQRAGLDGTVYAIDPLPGTTSGSPASYHGATPDAAEVNFRNMGVANRIVLVTELSDPWPLPDREFGTAYIDGQHDRGWPLRDWQNVKERVTERVIFHDFDGEHPEVWNVVERAERDKDWELLYDRSPIAVVGRVNGP